MAPTVSIIIPTYNRADLVGRAIESVLAQTRPDWEAIVVDDGSTDNTRQIVAQYPDPRIRYIYQENKKLPGARNTGIRNSQGTYLAFLDSDDRFLPDKLALQLAAFERQSALGLVASGWVDVDAEGHPTAEQRPWLLRPSLTLDDWLFHNPFVPGGVLVKREWVRRVGLFDEGQFYVEDWDLWLRLAYAGCPMAWEPALVCEYTITAGSMARQAERMTAGLLRLMQKFFDQPNLPVELQAQRGPVLANANLDGAIRHLGAGLLAEGQAFLQAALRLDATLGIGNPAPVLQSLVGAAHTNLIRDRRAFRDLACQALVYAAPQLSCTPRRFDAFFYANEAFTRHANGQRQAARQNALHAFWLDPSWLANRGLWSIVLKP